MKTFLQRWKQRIRGSLTVVAAVCLPIECTDIGRAIEALGFQQISPPSTSAGPGSMVYIKQDHPLRVGMICSVRHSLGSHFVPREHPTSQATFSKTRRRHFALGADVMSQVKADISLHSIKNVCVTLANPKIYLVDDTDVLHNIRYRSRICKRAVENRLRDNFKVSMIAETLEGDVTYTVTWDEGAKLSVRAKCDLMTNLRAKLKLEGAEIVGNSIVGRALVWGIIDDRWLAQSSLTERVSSGEDQWPETHEVTVIPDDAPQPVEMDPRPEIPMRPSRNPGNARYR